MVAFWKRALVLWMLAMVGAALVLPYVSTLESQVLAQAAGRLRLAVWQVLALSMVQSSVLFAGAILSGLWAAGKAGFGTPLLDAALARQAPPPNAARTLGMALVLGIGTALVLLPIDHWGFARDPSVAALLRASEHEAVKPARWMGLLASFYGAFDEEVLMRLCVLSLVALGLGKLLPRAVAFHVANVIAAVVFGLGHLPATAALAPLSAALVMRAIVLNGVVGVVAGALYRRWGLEWAMASHLGFDLVAHVVL